MVQSVEIVMSRGRLLIDQDMSISFGDGAIDPDAPGVQDCTKQITFKTKQSRRLVEFNGVDIHSSVPRCASRLEDALDEALPLQGFQCAHFIGLKADLSLLFYDGGFMAYQ